MSKVNVRCSIVNAEDKKRIVTKGIQKGNTLLFYDDQHVKHDITFGEKRVRYRRTGPVFMDFIFEKEVSHSGNYQVQEGGFIFTVHTHELEIRPNELVVSYSLKQDGMLVNKGHLSVTYEEI
ncbi:MAG: DUF1934 family protein [Candidatus Izemoplasmataceae bacterium]